ncbi:MAG: hypothetical protein ACKVP0_14650 [Pirellulaceae bacterium]
MRFCSFLLGQVADSATQEDVATLILGDWAGLNWLRGFVLLLLVMACCVPLYRGLNIIQLLNWFCFPFWLNDRLDKFDDWLDKK